MIAPGKSNAGPHQAPRIVETTPAAKTTVPTAASFPESRRIGASIPAETLVAAFPHFGQRVLSESNGALQVGQVMVGMALLVILGGGRNRLIA
jgi:hypothetical protein